MAIPVPDHSGKIRTLIKILQPINQPTVGEVVKIHQPAVEGVIKIH